MMGCARNAQYRPSSREKSELEWNGESRGLGVYELS
jgi:hypothetical protein